MLIVNADDLGGTDLATDNIIACARQKRITSASAMVFMKSSQHAAELASGNGLETGLHLNLTLPFDGPQLHSQLKEHQLTAVRYFLNNRIAQVLYNPFIFNSIEYIFKAQYEEYIRLYKMEPLKLDGHHHVHLCMNVIMGRLIPLGIRVRRNLTFIRGEKNLINRFYRYLVDAWLIRNHICTDILMSIEPMQNHQRLKRIFQQACSLNVELMVHPTIKEQLKYLLSDDYQQLLASVPSGTYSMLQKV